MSLKMLRTIALVTISAAGVLGSLQIMHPKELKNQLNHDGIIKSGLGNFGHIVYGSSILGRVYFPSNNKDGCREYVKEDFPDEFYVDEDSDLNPIILADRGNCSFVTKVRNIERHGVKLAIIAD